MNNIKKAGAILLAATILTTVHTYLQTTICYAENVIIIRKENKKGQGADVVIRPDNKHNKIEIRTRI